MSALLRGLVVGLMVSPLPARADVAPRDIGGCSKVGAKCELDGRPGKCQTKTRIQRLPKPGGGTTAREREYVACVPTGPAPAKVETKAAEPAAPPEPASGPVPTLPPAPVSEPVQVAPVREPVPASAVNVPVPAPVTPAPETGGGMCRVAMEAPCLGLAVLLLLRRRRR